MRNVRTILPEGIYCANFFSISIFCTTEIIQKKKKRKNRGSQAIQKILESILRSVHKNLSDEQRVVIFFFFFFYSDSLRSVILSNVSKHDNLHSCIYLYAYAKRNYGAILSLKILSIFRASAFLFLQITSRCFSLSIVCSFSFNFFFFFCSYSFFF